MTHEDKLIFVNYKYKLEILMLKLPCCAEAIVQIVTNKMTRENFPSIFLMSFHIDTYFVSDDDELVKISPKFEFTRSDKGPFK